MERDKSHKEQIIRWAEYVKTNPNWKEKLKPFLDSQIIKAQRIFHKLSKSEEGRRKILLLRGLK